MPFEFGDQPDYCTTGTLPRYWDLYDNDMEVAAGDGFAGANGWTASSADAYLVRFPVGVDTREFGFVVRLYIDSLPGSDAIILGAVDAPPLGSPGSPLLQVCAVLNTDGTMSIYRGDVATGTLLATSSSAVPTGAHVRLGFSGTIDPSNGSATVWLGIDGDPDETLQPLVQVGGVSTDDTGSGRRRGVYMGGTPDLVTSHLYTQGGGTLPNNPLATVLYPGADTSLQDWSMEPDTADDLVDVISDVTPNDEDDYGFASAVGDSFAVTHETMPDLAGILGVRSVATVRSPDLPTPTFTYTPLSRSGGGAVRTGTLRSITPSWTGADKVDPVNPFTGLPWTPDEINATGWGGRTTP